MSKTSRENAARRNLTLRKIRAAQHIPPEIKLAIQVVLDLLSSKSAYQVAWPSAATIAKRSGRSRRTGKWYVRTIRALGIFNCRQLSPTDARSYCEKKYGFKPPLDRCVTNATILFEPNLEHPLWDSDMKLPAESDRDMGEIIQRIKEKRNAKTTSQLATNPANHPAGESDAMETLGGRNKFPRYCLESIREKLQETQKGLLDGVANDIIYGVANDTQVFKLSSVEANDTVASLSETLKTFANPSVTVSPKGSAVRQPCSRFPRTNTPPAHHSARGSAKQNQNLAEQIAFAASECKAAADAASLYWNQIPEPERGILFSRWSHPFTENGIQILEPASIEDSPWLHRQRSSLRD